MCNSPVFFSLLPSPESEESLEVSSGLPLPPLDPLPPLLPLPPLDPFPPFDPSPPLDPLPPLDPSPPLDPFPPFDPFPPLPPKALTRALTVSSSLPPLFVNVLYLSSFILPPLPPLPPLLPSPEVSIEASIEESVEASAESLLLSPGERKSGLEGGVV